MNAKFYPFLWCAGSLLEYVFSFFFSRTEACEVLAYSCVLFLSQILYWIVFLFYLFDFLLCRYTLCINWTSFFFFCKKHNFSLFKNGVCIRMYMYFFFACFWVEDYSIILPDLWLSNSAIGSALDFLSTSIWRVIF